MDYEAYRKARTRGQIAAEGALVHLRTMYRTGAVPESWRATVEHVMHAADDAEAQMRAALDAPMQFNASEAA